MVKTQTDLSSIVTGDVDQYIVLVLAIQVTDENVHWLEPEMVTEEKVV